MSSISNVYGITPYTWIPGPDFKAGFDNKGMWTGSQTFTCRKFDFESTAIQTAFQKGQSVTVLYPNLSTKWNFLTVDSVEHEHQPGGITKIFVSYTGFSADWEFDKNNDSGTYAYNASEAEAPIMTHPAFLALPAVDQQLIAQVIRGEMKIDPSRTRTTTNIYLCDPLGQNGKNITNANAILWFNIICDQKQETYQASQIEWTHSATNQGGVDASYLAKHGWIDPDPDGDPPVIAGRNWRLTGITDSQTKQGTETTSDYSITWTMSPPGTVWNTTIYTKPT